MNNVVYMAFGDKYNAKSLGLSCIAEACRSSESLDQHNPGCNRVLISDEIKIDFLPFEKSYSLEYICDQVGGLSIFNQIQGNLLGESQKFKLICAFKIKVCQWASTVFDKFLYLDSDTYIQGSLDYIFGLGYNIAVARDYPIEKIFNCGVLYFNNAIGFAEEWWNNWKSLSGFHDDQIAFLKTYSLTSLTKKELDWRVYNVRPDALSGKVLTEYQRDSIRILHSRWGIPENLVIK